MPQSRECCQFAARFVRSGGRCAYSRLQWWREGGMRAAMVPDSPLDDPRFAAFAWARYKRLMRWMALVTLSVVVVAMILLYRANGFVSIHLYIAAGLGIAVAMLLMSALMGLVFLSSGTGHDDAIVDPLDDDSDF
jgi:hypothetical protein